jgi:hypothetical protein
MVTMTAVAREPRDREQIARRLLRSASKNSYDPQIDIDWDAPIDEGELAFMPFERVSLYGTPIWDRLTDWQKHELAKHELASVAGTGLWFEIILIEMLARYCFTQDPQAEHTQFALTEIGDETRHVIMFARAIKRMGVPTYRPPAAVDQLAKLYKRLSKGVTLFAPVLVAEEMTDRLQRETMNDDGVHPLIRMVNRIHVVEEARHVRFAREEVARLMPRLSASDRMLASVVVALTAAGVVESLINPGVYAAIGLDPKRAWLTARRNPHNLATRKFLGERTMQFLDEQGLVTTLSRPIYKAVGLL